MHTLTCSTSDTLRACSMRGMSTCSPTLPHSAAIVFVYMMGHGMSCHELHRAFAPKRCACSALVICVIECARTRTAVCVTSSVVALACSFWMETMNGVAEDPYKFKIGEALAAMGSHTLMDNQVCPLAIALL